MLFNPVRFVIGDAVYLSSPDANEGDEYRIKWWNASSAEGSKFRKQVFGSVFVLKLPDDSRIWGSFLKLELVQKHSATHSANRNLFLFPAMHKTSGVFSIRIGEQANFFSHSLFSLLITSKGNLFREEISLVFVREHRCQLERIIARRKHLRRLFYFFDWNFSYRWWFIFLFKTEKFFRAVENIF